jgi:hypothetical protein
VTCTSEWRGLSAVEGPSKGGLQASEQLSDRHRHREAQDNSYTYHPRQVFFFFFLDMPPGGDAEDGGKGALGCQRDRPDQTERIS